MQLIARIESPINLATAFKREILRLDYSHPTSAQFPRLRGDLQHVQLSYRVACFETDPNAGFLSSAPMGGITPGGVGATPPRASFFGVRSLSLVFADFGTLLFFASLFIFILSFLFWLSSISRHRELISSRSRR